MNDAASSSTTCSRRRWRCRQWTWWSACRAHLTCSCAHAGLDLLQVGSPGTGGHASSRSRRSRQGQQAAEARAPRRRRSRLQDPMRRKDGNGRRFIASHLGLTNCVALPVQFELRPQPTLATPHPHYPQEVVTAPAATNNVEPRRAELAQRTSIPVGQDRSRAIWLDRGAGPACRHFMRTAACRTRWRPVRHDRRSHVPRARAPAGARATQRADLGPGAGRDL